MNSELQDRYELLKKRLDGLGSALIAFSGGVDSTFLAKAAFDQLGEKALAVTACSPTYPAREFEEAKKLAGQIGIRHMVIETSESNDPLFAANPPDRCYHCKKELFGKLVELAESESIDCVLDGSNADDTDDYRPGTKAAEELGVLSPLREAGLTKRDIREISRELGLSTHDKPSFACLASRFPYGTKIDDEALKQVGEAEEILRSLGFRQVRVRHHGATARIEVEPEKVMRIMDPEMSEKISRELHKLGYTYVSVDLDGYRTGAMNEVLGGATGPCSDAEPPGGRNRPGQAL